MISLSLSFQQLQKLDLYFWSVTNLANLLNFFESFFRSFFEYFVNSNIFLISSPLTRKVFPYLLSILFLSFFAIEVFPEPDKPVIQKKNTFIFVNLHFTNFY